MPACICNFDNATVDGELFCPRNTKDAIVAVCPIDDKLACSAALTVYSQRNTAEIRPAINGKRRTVTKYDICVHGAVVGRFRQRNITIDIEPAVA